MRVSKSPHEIRVGEERLSAGRIFINVGGRAIVPDMPGLDEFSYLTNSSMLELDVLPRHLVVVGGSYVGLEFAQMYRRFGSEVTVVEKGSRLIQREDEDVSAADQGHSRSARASTFVCAPNASASRGAARMPRHGRNASRAIRRSLAPTCCWRSDGGRTPTISASTTPVSTSTSAGYIVVDDELRTSVPGIWALGDCNGKGAFTHTAYNDFEIVAANLLDGDRRRVSDRIARLRALYRSAARPRRSDRGRGAALGKARLVGGRP